MTEFDKAKAVIVDKNNSFAKLREVAGGSISRLNVYRHNPEKLRTARWIVVHNLASLYHEQGEQLWKTNYKYLISMDNKFVQ